MLFSISFCSFLSLPRSYWNSGCYCKSILKKKIAASHHLAKSKFNTKFVHLGAIVLVDAFLVFLHILLLSICICMASSMSLISFVSLYSLDMHFFFMFKIDVCLCVAECCFVIYFSCVSFIVHFVRLSALHLHLVNSVAVAWCVCVLFQITCDQCLYS